MVFVCPNVRIVLTKENNALVGRSGHSQEFAFSIIIMYYNYKLKANAKTKL